MGIVALYYYRYFYITKTSIFVGHIQFKTVICDVKFQLKVRVQIPFQLI
jgi:hypothetical protein